MSLFKQSQTILTILTLLLQLTHRVNSLDTVVPLTPPVDPVHTSNNPNTFTVPLDHPDYSRTYYATVTPEQRYPGPSCRFFPAPITSGHIFSTDITNSWLDAPTYQLDYFSTYRFVSKTTESSIEAIGPNGYIGRILTTAGQELTDDVKMVIDPAGTMYVLNYDSIFTYPLAPFIAAVTSPPPITIPDISSPETIFYSPTALTELLDAKFDTGTGYIFIRTSSEVGFIQNPSTPTPPYLKVFDSTDPAFGSFGPLMDFAVLGSHIYVLQDKAFTVMEIADNTKFKFVTHRRGRFIEVDTNSIIVMGDTTSLVSEYFIINDPSDPDIGKKITFNRHVPVQHGNRVITDTAIDDSHLYIATTTDTYVIRHSIPERFSLDNQFQEHLIQFAGESLKLTSVVGGGASTFITLKGTIFAETAVSVTKPFLWCLATKLAGCEFTSDIEAYQRTCPTLLPDPSDACQLTQKMSINVLNSAKDCPDNTKPALGRAVTPGLKYNNPGSFTTDNGEIQPTNQKLPVKTNVNKGNGPTNLPIVPRYNQTRNAERARNKTENQNLWSKVPKATASSTRIPLPPTGSPTASSPERTNLSTKVVDQVMKTGSIATESDEQKDQKMMEMMIENKQLMNGLIVCVVVLLVVVSLLVVFVIWFFAMKQKVNLVKIEKMKEEENSELVVIPNAKIRKRIDLSTSQIIHTLGGDESKIYTDADASRIEFVH